MLELGCPADEFTAFCDARPVKGLQLNLLRRKHPGAQMLVLPESPRSVIEQAGAVGLTSTLLKTVIEGSARRWAQVGGAC